MSNTSNSPALKSEQEIVTWLNKHPRTSKWDALLIYDRLKANQLLLQEYIDRFTSGTFLKPITDKVTVDPNTHWVHLYDYVLDYPRISFEKNSFGDSRVSLTMNIMGGTQMTVQKDAMSPKVVTQIEWIDALQGPKLTADVELWSLPIQVSERDQVWFDIAAARDFRLSFADTDSVRELGGTFFYQLFQDLPDDQKRYFLNTLEPVDENDFLDPIRGAIIIFPAPGSKQRSSPHYGDGALLYYVAVEGTENTELPADEVGWVYPIPQGRSSLVLLGNHALIKKIVSDGIRKLSASAEVEYENEDNAAAPVGTVSVTSGQTAKRMFNLTSPAFNIVEFSYGLPLAAGKTAFTIATNEGKLSYSWSGTSSDSTQEAKLVSSGPAAYSLWTFNWRVEAVGRFQLVDGTVVLRRDDDVTIEVSARPKHPMAVEHEADLATLVPAIEQGLREDFIQLLDDVMAPSREIDLFRLHGLLFRGDNLVELNSVHFPTDLAMFGDVSPKRTTFVVDPLEPIVAPGSKTPFKVLPEAPAGQTIRWSVEEVPGYGAQQGSIDQNGVYTAPAASTIPGKNYTFAKVRASTDVHESSALVRVVVRDVVVNPLVKTSELGGAKTKLGAGTLDRGALEWTIKSQTGATIEPIDLAEHPEFEPGDHYYVPGNTPSGAPYSVDEIIVTNPRTNNSHSAYVLVAEVIPSLTITVVDDPDLPEHQIQLQYGNDETPPATWTLLAGGGELSSTGLYTYDPTSVHRFAVISATFNGMGMSFANALILPVPLVNLEEMRRVLA